MKKLLIKVVCILVAMLALVGATAASNSGQLMAGGTVETLGAVIATPDEVATPDQATVLATTKPTEAKPTEQPTEAVTEKPTAVPTEFVEEYDWDDYEYVEETEIETEVPTTYAEEETEEEQEADNEDERSEYIYSPSEFQNSGIITWGGWTWTYYSQNILPGEGLYIPGRHVDSNGYVCDENGYLCLASTALSWGTVVNTPFGKPGRVYDSGCASYILDVYVAW